MSSGIASKTEVGGTGYAGVIKIQEIGVCASEGAAKGMSLLTSLGMLTKKILKYEASQSPEMQSSSLAW